MLYEFEDLAQFFFSTRGGQLDRPAEITLAGVKLFQKGKILCVQLANAHRPQSRQIAQQHDGIGATRKQFPMGAEFNLIKIQFLARGAAVVHGRFGRYFPLPRRRRDVPFRRRRLARDQALDLLNQLRASIRHSPVRAGIEHGAQNVNASQ